MFTSKSMSVLTASEAVQLRTEKWWRNLRADLKKNEENAMFGEAAAYAELSRSLGLTRKEIEQMLAVGGDLAEKQFMECCWCLWKADGIELVEPFIDTAFNILPE
jgi:hypothetical protein